MKAAKLSPHLSPQQTSPSDVRLANPFGDMLFKSGGVASVGDDKSTSILHDALTSSMNVAMGVFPESTSTSEKLFSEKLPASFGDKVCLSCPFCSQSFKSKTDLEKHSKIHLNTGTQKCNICDQVFPSAGILAEHKLSHCKIQQGNVCVACKVPVRGEEEFYLHSQEHGFQGAVMQCIVCRQTLASMMELQMHGKHHFQTKAGFYTCCVCLSSFDTCNDMVSKLNSSGRTYYVCKSCYTGGGSDLICKICGAKCESSAALEVHAATHKKSYQCIKCQESFSSEHEIQLHVATHMMTEGNIHECFLCCVVLDSPAKLQCHLIEHTFKDAEKKCNECGRVFMTSQEIQAHALEHGISARRHACSQCNQRFFFSAELENHSIAHKKTQIALSLGGETTAHYALASSKGNIMHSDFGSKPKQNGSAKSPSCENKESLQLQCWKCDWTCNSLINLTDHYKIKHPNIDRKTHPCPCCPESFRSISTMQLHFLRHHGKDVNGNGDREQRLSCMECGKECSSEQNLISHINTHRKGRARVLRHFSISSLVWHLKRMCVYLTNIDSIDV